MPALFQRSLAQTNLAAVNKAFPVAAMSRTEITSGPFPHVTAPISVTRFPRMFALAAILKGQWFGRRWHISIRTAISTHTHHRTEKFDQQRCGINKLNLS